MTKPVDNDPETGRQERKPEQASDASGSPPPDDGHDDYDAEPNDDDNYPNDDDDNEDPVVEPAATGRRAPLSGKRLATSDRP